MKRKNKIATLHLMVGLPGSGKTTRARELEEEYDALRLTPDEWHFKLFGNDVESVTHDENHQIIEKSMWEIAERALRLGVDVILDFGFWAREERDDFRNRAKKLGANFRIHYMDVPIDELYARLEKRNDDDNYGFVISSARMDEYLRHWEPPTGEELTNFNY